MNMRTNQSGKPQKTSLLSMQLPQSKNKTPSDENPNERKEGNSDAGEENSWQNR